MVVQADTAPSDTDDPRLVRAVPVRRGRASVSRWVTAVPDLVGPAVAGFSVPAMVLLLLGWFVVPVVLAAGVATASVAVALALRNGPHEGAEASDTRHALLWTSLALALAAGFVTFNSRYSAENLYVTRDPGTYTVTAQWLTHSREALVPAGDEVFGTVPGIGPESLGFMSDRSDPDLITPQGNHLLPVLMSVGGWFGGPGVLLRVNALIGGLALLAVFGLARRVAGGGFALVATAALGLSMPMLAFSRDSYSEPLTVLLLFGGLSLLWRAVESNRRSQFLVAGACLGSTALARIDAYAALLAVIAAAVATVAVARPTERRPRLVRVSWLAVGTIATASLGYMDVTRLSSYYYADHRHLIVPLLYAALLLAVAGVAAIAVAWRTRIVAALVVPHVRTWARVAAAMLSCVFVVLASRPLWMKGTGDCNELVGALQSGLGLDVEPCRTYEEQTVSWFAWYYGWPTYALAVAGLALLAHRVVRRRDVRLLTLVAAVAVVSLLYFVEPSIYPDQVWAMRRFLPVVIPGLLVSVSYLLHVLWEPRALGRAGRVGAGLAVALAVVVVVTPAAVTHPMWPVRTGVGQLAQVEAVCDRIGPDAAVVSLGRSHIGTYTQTIRSFCGVPTQAMEFPSTVGLAEARANVAASERTLFVVAERAQFVPYEPGTPAVPGPFFTAAVTKWPERLESVPQHTHHYVVPLYLGEVNVDGTVQPVRSPARDG